MSVLILDKEYEEYIQQKDEIDRLNKECDTYMKIATKKQQRIDKAIEYNYELQERYCHSAIFDELVASEVYEIAENNLNILQGEDNENK